MGILASLMDARATSAVALLIADTLLSGFAISVLDFPIVVIIFAAILVVARATTETIIDKNAHVLANVVGLIGAFVALLITKAVASGLTIHGLGTPIAASIIVWLGMVIVNLLVGRWIFPKRTGRDTPRHAQRAVGPSRRRG